MLKVTAFHEEFTNQIKSERIENEKEKNSVL